MARDVFIALTVVVAKAPYIHECDSSILVLLQTPNAEKCPDSLNKLFRAIFVSLWNENARTKQKQQANGNKAIWLVYRTYTNARGFRLVKRTLG